MSAKTEALREAKSVYERRTTMTREDKVAAVRSLAEWGVFSNNHLAAITDMKRHLVAGYTQKTDQTGGTFHPRAIPALLEIVALRQRSEKDVFATLAAFESGCGVRMMHRLTGMPETTISRQITKARALRGAEGAVAA